MPRQVSVSTLKRQNSSPTNGVGAAYTKVKCPGCARRSGANQNVQFLKQTRMRFADKGLLAEAPDNATANDDALSILSSMGIGVITKAPKSPNPRSADNTSAYVKSDFSLLKLETDTAVLPSSTMLDSISFSKKTGGVLFVPMKKMYKPPSELALDEKSNIFKPDNNPTNIERRRAMRLIKQKDAKVLKLIQKIERQQSGLAGVRVRLMSPHYKIIMGKEGT